MAHLIDEMMTSDWTPFMRDQALRQMALDDDLWIIDREETDEGFHTYLVISASSANEAIAVAMDWTSEQYCGDWTHVYSIVSMTSQKVTKD